MHQTAGRELFALDGQVALVTGGFSGFGRHFASVLASHGARVAIAGRRIDLGRSVAQDLSARSGRPGAVEAFELDVTREASVAGCVQQAGEAFGPLTIVVNNAGIVSRAPTLEMTADDWNGVVDVNLSGVFRVAQAAARQMVARGQGGSIINIASILGLRVRAQVSAYAASKAAVVQLTKALALESAPHRIRVNAIAPGYFQTELNAALLASEAGRAIVSRIPQQRTGELHELDGALLLLASGASSYITGNVIAVDGGHLVSTL